MALGGFGLNPFQNVAHLGTNIGSIFGNTADSGTGILGDQPSLNLFAPASGGGTATKQAGPTTANPSGGAFNVVPLSSPTSTGQTLGDSTYGAAPDPYAAYGGTAAYNNLVSGFGTQKQNIYGSANDAASALQPGYAQSILDTIHNLTTGQQGIDRLNVQNESSKIQGGRNILDMIGRGVKSGGVYLANRNAGNSSAAGAIAQAYGEQGRRQMSSIGQQYASNQGDIGVKQAEQDYQQSQAPNKFHIDLMNNVNNIVSQARDKFAQLDAAMASASLPDRIAIEQEKENVRSQVLGSLQQYDSQLASGVQGIHAAGQDQNRTTANQQLQAGTADPSLFQYTDQAPLQVQGSGPVASNLPIYSNKRQLQYA